MTVTVNGLPLNDSQAADFRDAIGLSDINVSSGVTIINAVVRHRTGARAALLALAGTAPSGEIALATDSKTVVGYFPDGTAAELGGGVSSSNTQLIDASGSTSGAFSASINAGVRFAHIKIASGSTQDITIALPTLPTAGNAGTDGRSIVITADSGLDLTKSITLTDGVGGSTITTFTASERLTLSEARNGYDLVDGGLAPAFWAAQRELRFMQGDVYSPGGINLASMAATGIGGGRVFTYNGFAAGYGSTVYSSAAGGGLAIGNNAATGSSAANTGGQSLAIGGGASGVGAGGPVIAQFDYSIAFNTPNTENAWSSYYRVGRDNVYAEFAYFRSTTTTTTTSINLSLMGTAGSGTTLGANRFIFNRPGIYTLLLDCLVRQAGTNNGWSYRKRVVVVNDTSTGSCVKIGEEIVGSIIQSGMGTILTSTDPFVVTVDSTTKALNIAFALNAAASPGVQPVVYAQCFMGLRI